MGYDKNQNLFNLLVPFHISHLQAFRLQDKVYRLVQLDFTPEVLCMMPYRSLSVFTMASTTQHTSFSGGIFSWTTLYRYRAARCVLPSCDLIPWEGLTFCCKTPCSMQPFKPLSNLEIKTKLMFKS